MYGWYEWMSGIVIRTGTNVLGLPWRKKIVGTRVDEWTRAGAPGARSEPGEWCLVDEMQILAVNGWRHDWIKTISNPRKAIVFCIRFDLICMLKNCFSNIIAVLLICKSWIYWPMVFSSVTRVIHDKCLMLSVHLNWMMLDKDASSQAEPSTSKLANICPSNHQQISACVNIVNLIFVFKLSSNNITYET